MIGFLNLDLFTLAANSLVGWSAGREQRGERKEASLNTKRTALESLPPPSF